MTGSMFWKVSVLTMTVWFSLLATADPTRAIASASPTGLDRHEFQSAISGRSLSQKDIIFRSLLSTEGKDLAWPNFPRTWHEESQTDMVNTNTRVGLASGPISGGVSIDYKWSLKTSLVIVASNRSNDSPLDNRGVTLNPAEEAPQFEIFRWDDATQRTLPNVRPDYPMIAFCAFEASLNYGVSARGGVEFFGNGRSYENGTIHSISHTIFSRFIQVDGTMSPIEMLNQLCEREFRPQVEQYADRDFARTVAELQSHQNPANECQPSSDDGAAGDTGCMAWFQRNIDWTLQKITTPRCVLDSRGIHRCELRAKKNVGCGMFWNKRARDYVPGTSPDAIAGFLTKVTNSAYEFNCDAKQGLTCRMVQSPKMLWGVPVWQGTARCM